MILNTGISYFTVIIHLLCMYAWVCTDVCHSMHLEASGKPCQFFPITQVPGTQLMSSYLDVYLYPLSIPTGPCISFYSPIYWGKVHMKLLQSFTFIIFHGSTHLCQYCLCRQKPGDVPQWSSFCTMCMRPRTDQQPQDQHNRTSPLLWTFSFYPLLTKLFGLCLFVLI